MWKFWVSRTNVFQDGYIIFQKGVDKFWHAKFWFGHPFPIMLQKERMRHLTFYLFFQMMCVFWIVKHCIPLLWTRNVWSMIGWTNWKYFNTQAWINPQSFCKFSISKVMKSSYILSALVISWWHSSISSPLFLNES